MKKVLIIILSALALLSIIGIIIFSSCKCKNKPKEQVYRVKFEGNSYIKTDDYLTLEKIINDTENKVVDLPTEIEGLKVKALGDKAFENAKLKKIIIPETVETIGVSCFANCSNLTDVVIETKTENGTWGRKQRTACISRCRTTGGRRRQERRTVPREWRVCFIRCVGNKSSA